MAIEVKPTGIDSGYRSDSQKNDRTGFSDDTHNSTIAKRDIADKASDAAHEIGHKAKDAGDKLKDKAEDVKHSMQDTGHDIAEKAKHTHHAICDFTRENPTAGVLMAFGLGAILARILPGR